MERKFFEDNELIHAVIECNFKKVKELVENKFSAPIYDIGGWEKQCPVFIISKAYQIIFEYLCEDKTIVKFAKENEKILQLFTVQFGLGNISELLIEDYSGLFFETEKERTMHSDAITNFDITDNLNEVLAEEITGMRRSSIIKKLCELGADPYYKNSDGKQTIELCEQDVQIGLLGVATLLKEPQDVYTISMIVLILALARNIQNYEIMTNYSE